MDIPADGHAEPRTRAPARLLRDLQGHLIEGDHVVLAHRALGMLAEDAIEIDAVQGDKGARGVGGRVGELLVVVGDEPLGQVGMAAATVVMPARCSSLTRRPWTVR